MTRRLDIIVQITGIDRAGGDFLDPQGDWQACPSGSLDLVHLRLRNAAPLAHFGERQAQRLAKRQNRGREGVG